jgi:hypothetical protein
MSACEVESEMPNLSTEDARIRVGTALALLELAAQVFEELPPLEVAFRLGDRELYRYLQAAETAESWLVGLDPDDSVDHPGAGSALGDGQRIYRWSEEETERHFENALRDWSERSRGGFV